MKTLCLRIDRTLDRWLTDEAKRLGRTKSDLIRETLDRQRNGKPKRSPSVHELAKDYCGIIKGGPRDVSTNMRKYLAGFGK
jgi:hypothetical protein